MTLAVSNDHKERKNISQIHFTKPYKQSHIRLSVTAVSTRSTHRRGLSPGQDIILSDLSRPGQGIPRAKKNLASGAKVYPVRQTASDLSGRGHPRNLYWYPTSMFLVNAPVGRLSGNVVFVCIYLQLANLGLI